MTTQAAQNILQIETIQLNEQNPLHVRAVVQLLADAENYWPWFGATPPEQNYDQWMKDVLALLRESETYLAFTGNEAHGAVWVSNLEWRKGEIHAVEIGGFARRKTPQVWINDALNQLIDRVIETYNPKIIRAEYAMANSPARRAMKRVGFTNPEPRKGMMTDWRGLLIDGEVVSLVPQARSTQAPTQ